MSAPTSVVLPEYRVERVKCVCGCNVQKNSFPAHLLSKKHRVFIQDQKQNKTKVEVGTFLVSL
jgi:hypothetical protein